MNKLLVTFLILLIVTSCGTSHNNQVTWIQPINNAVEFEQDKATCEKDGLDTAGSKPTFLIVPSCGHSRGYSMMLGNDCATYQHRVYALNRRLHEEWLSEFASGYNECMFDKGYTLQSNQQKAANN